MKTILYFQSSCCENNDALLRGVCRLSHKSKWNVQVIPYAKAAASRQLDVADGRVMPAVGELVEFWKPRGAIVECGSAVGLLTAADFPSLPVVFLDCSYEVGAPAVRSDNSGIAECAVRELLSLGFADYAYVPWLEPLSWSIDRGKVFAERVRAKGRFCHDFAWSGDLSEASLRSQLSDWLRDLPHPVGIFAANDYIASVVVACAKGLRLRVPEDVAVIGVDNDLRICDYAQPPLSSIAPDYERAGETAAALLSRLLRKPGEPVDDAFFGAARVVRRESTRLMRRRGRHVEMVLEIVRSRACDGLSPAEVAAEIGCSRRLLEIRIREATGHTMLDEIRQVRIERAKQLLEHDDLLLDEVAHRCGYRSECAFRRAFKQETGRSPRRLRR